MKTTMTPPQWSPSALAARAFLGKLSRAYRTKQHMSKWVPREQASTSWPSEYLVRKRVPREEVPRDQVSATWPSEYLVTQWVPREEVPRDQASTLWGSTLWGSEYLVRKCHVTKRVPCDQVSTSWPSDYLMMKYHVTKKVPRDQASTLVTKWVPRDGANTSWASKYLVMCTPSAISDLSYYINIIYKTWGQSERLWGKTAWLLQLANLLFPYKNQISFCFCIQWLLSGMLFPPCWHWQSWSSFII